MNQAKNDRSDSLLFTPIELRSVRLRNRIVSPRASIRASGARIHRNPFGLTMAALLIVAATQAEARGFYRKDTYTVKDLIWCLDARPPPLDSPCMDYALGVAELVRHGEVRLKGKPVCWPASEPVTRVRVFEIFMRREKLRKWDPSSPAASFIATMIAEAYPCKK